MAESTGISWCRSTFNPWLGCTKVGPGCDGCYAESMDARRVFQGTTHWGPGVPRMRTSPANWNQVRRWDRQAPDSQFAGLRGYWPVFSASLADIFDNEVPESWRTDFWALVRECSNLTFLIVTKRIGNAARMLPADWGRGYPNVVLLATIVNQAEADRDIPKLLATPAHRRGLSMEPLLGPVDLSVPLGVYQFDESSCWSPRNLGRMVGGLDWVIVGGESGPGARPMHPEWAHNLQRQCAAAGAPFHFKQWGEWVSPAAKAFGTAPGECGFIRADGSFWSEPPVEEDADAVTVKRVGVAAAGRDLAGREHDEHPGESLDAPR